MAGWLAGPPGGRVAGPRGRPAGGRGYHRPAAACLFPSEAAELAAAAVVWTAGVVAGRGFRVLGELGCWIRGVEGWAGADKPT